MKIAPKHTRITLSNIDGKRIVALRVNASLWTLQREDEDRKDGIEEQMLQSYIDAGKFRVESVFATETVSIDIETADAVRNVQQLVYAIGALGASVEQVMTGPSMRELIDSGVLVPLCLHHHCLNMDGGGADDQTGVAELIIRDGEIVGVRFAPYHIDGAKNENEPAASVPMLMKAGDEGIPLDMIESAQEITVMQGDGLRPIYFRRNKLGAEFSWAHKALPEDIFPFSQASEKQVAQMTAGREFTVKQFPQREFYDHLSVRYGDLCKQVAHSSQTVTALERDLGAARDLYNKQCDEREALYARMVALGQ